MDNTEQLRTDLTKIVHKVVLTPKQINKMKEVLQIETQDKEVHIKDGFKLLRDLRKEAKRQKTVKIAEDLELQSRDIECVPDIPSIHQETALADSFEITEE
jgi:hypothetical protein